MLNLTRLWLLTYKTEKGALEKVKFYTYENDYGTRKEYRVQYESRNECMLVTKEEGNEIFKSIVENNKKVKLCKIR